MKARIVKLYIDQSNVINSDGKLLIDDSTPMSMLPTTGSKYFGDMGYGSNHGINYDTVFDINEAKEICQILNKYNNDPSIIYKVDEFIE